MSESSDSAESCTMFRCSRCSGDRSESSTSPVMPMMAFIGVRISCDMFARNALFAWFADSACSLACFRASSPCLRRVMSCSTVANCTVCFAAGLSRLPSPTSNVIGCIAISAMNDSPDFFTSGTSRRLPISDPSSRWWA